ncbi:PREDICTED: cation/H(+) antiporter 1-like [Erythranthe guttata]|uniref:cation/H(+) antiporter 1-like n=1 Tax=Erythranthe guttata TaxID=4155 RepID=UPI00064D7776|nr:PREDICTED: cation/H(+) antiporter 1-like [Erythranthe guttata]|eukprot:XP_012845749.1 PREDICTED: cation/H(+) antiporter 1-like [Erythranthe guttata]
MQAGFVLGPSCLSQISNVKSFFFSSSADYYETMALYARIIIMFLIGLETDFPYLLRKLRIAGTIACGSCFICTVFAAAVTSFIFTETGAHGSHFIMALTLSIILSNTASPFVTRLAHDLKFANTDIGRLAISSSLISDAYAVLLLIIITRDKQEYGFKNSIFLGILYSVVIIVVIVVNRHVANWLNRRNRSQKYLKNTEIFILLAILFVAATSLETLGFSSIIACFLIGALFPRGGKTGRTLLIKLSYSVHNFVLPIYFGYSGFKSDLTHINSLTNFAIVAIIILLSIGGKVTGTLAACFHLKIPLNEGVLLAFLMNLKGHVDLLALTIGVENKVSVFIYLLLDFFFLIKNLSEPNVLIDAGSVEPTYMVRRESDILGYKHIAFEFQSPESELKLLACVHGPRPVATMIGLIATCKGSDNVAITPYLMHLIELPEKTKTTLLFHQKEEDELSDDDNYGGNDVVEINEAVDIFAAETGVVIHQLKVVSPFATMYDDVCEFAEDARASIIILPFHKHQRIDGKLESGKEGIRATNQKVLRHAKCSVAILVDRGLTAGTLHVSGSGMLQHVAMLFFGGPDDREALGLSKRLGMHHHVNLTVIRFLEKSEGGENIGVNITQKDEDVFMMAISNHELQNDADNMQLTQFSWVLAFGLIDTNELIDRYVTSGEVGYVEKHVAHGGETASALRDMADMYSMFIVGKGNKGHSTLTTGMSDWEECPELGKVGDFLASSDFELSGSVLVIQQHRPSNNGDDDL